MLLEFCFISLYRDGTCTVYPKKYAHGFCIAVLCCGYTWTDFPISTRLTSLALCQSNDCPSASKATLMNMDKYFMWIHYEWLHNHNKAKHNETVCIFLGIYCSWNPSLWKIRTYLTCIGNVMVADVLAMQGARASSWVMVFIDFIILHLQVYSKMAGIVEIFPCGK